MFEIMVEKFVELFILVVMGVIAFKSHLINSNSLKGLSNLLLFIVSPAVILNSYQMEYTAELFHGLMWAIVASALSFFVMIAASNLFISKKSPEYHVEKLASIYSNCGFVGIPIISGVLGNMGIFYITVYVAMFNIFVWTHGVFVMEKRASKISFYKNLLSPAIIAVIVGILMFINQIHLPMVISEPIRFLGDMNTPLAMIVAGANIAQTNVLEIFKKKRVYYVSILRLVVFPCITAAVLMLFPITFETRLSIWVAAACPTGTTAIMFSERYGKNAKYASEIFVITTILSMITIPLISMVLMKIF